MHLIGLAFLIVVGVILIRKWCANFEVVETGAEYETEQRASKNGYLNAEIIDVQPVDGDSSSKDGTAQ